MCCDQHFLSFIGISIMRVLGQKHSDKTSILTFFKVYSPYIKSGRRRREQDGQALNGPHNKSNIKTAEARLLRNIITLSMKGCVRIFRICSVTMYMGWKHYYKSRYMYLLWGFGYVFRGLPYNGTIVEVGWGQRSFGPDWFQKYLLRPWFCYGVLIIEVF